MLIDMYENIDYKVKGVILKDKNIILEDNQFLQWSLTGKRLELWDGKKEYLSHDREGTMRRLTYFNQNSVVAMI